MAHNILLIASLLAAFAIGTPPNDPASAAGAAPLYRAIRTYDLDRIHSLASTAAASPQRDLAKGIEASWLGDADRGSVSLEEAMRGAWSLARYERDEAQRYLALDYATLGKYAKAQKVGQGWLMGQTMLSGADLADFKSQAAMWKALAHERPMSVHLRGTARLPLIENHSRRLETNLEVHGVRLRVLVDTGAEYTVLSETAATRLHVRRLPAEIEDTGSTGIRKNLQLAEIDQFSVGPETVRHCPVGIEDDASMRIGPPGAETVVDMIVGYSLLRRFGAVGVEKGNSLVLNGDAPRAGRRGRLLEAGPVPILIGRFAKQPAGLLLDTGATTTILTQAFFRGNPAIFRDQQETLQTLAGVGGSRSVKRFVLPEFQLNLLDGDVLLKAVKVFPDPSALDVEGLLGNAGRDLWSDRDGFTIDFRNRELIF